MDVLPQGDQRAYYNERKHRVEQHRGTARANDDDNDDPYGPIEQVPWVRFGISELFLDGENPAAPLADTPAPAALDPQLGAPDPAPIPPECQPPPPMLPAQLPGPSGVHGNYFKGRRRSYTAYVQCGSAGESEDDWDCGPDSDDPHSDAYGD